MKTYSILTATLATICTINPCFAGLLPIEYLPAPDAYDHSPAYPNTAWQTYADRPGRHFSIREGDGIYNTAPGVSKVPVPFGTMRYPGTRGGAFVVPYKGKGDYEFEIVLSQGAYVASHSILMSGGGYRWAYLMATTQEVNGVIPEVFYSSYINLGGKRNCPLGTYVPLAALVPPDEELDGDYISGGLSWALQVSPPANAHVNGWTNQLAYFHPNSNAVNPGKRYVFTNYAQWELNNPNRITSPALPPEVGTVIGGNTLQVTLRFKVTIDGSWNDTGWKHLIVDDYVQAGWTNLLDDGVVSGAITLASVNYSGDELTGTVSGPAKGLMEGYKGNIPIQFSVAKE